MLCAGSNHLFPNVCHMYEYFRYVDDHSMLRSSSERQEGTRDQGIHSLGPASDEIADLAQIPNRRDEPTTGQHLEDSRNSKGLNIAQDLGASNVTRSPDEIDESAEDGYDDEDSDGYANLDEVADPAPDQNPADGPLYKSKSLEDARRQRRSQKNKSEAERRSQGSSQQASTRVAENDCNEDGNGKVKGKHRLATTRLASELSTISYLIFFSILGTLARLGLQAITFYPGAPVAFSELWANVAGSFIMGFLSEDRKLFGSGWAVSKHDSASEKEHQERKTTIDQESGSSGTSSRKVSDKEEKGDEDTAAERKKRHSANKKTIPLYIGLATGFCGSFTSFSSFIRDMFLALSNNLSTPLSHPTDYGVAGGRLTTDTTTVSRHGGYSFMALLAVLITTVALCICALQAGAHIAIAFHSLMPSLPYALTRKFFDRIAILLAFGTWLGAICLAIWPPDRRAGGVDIWRGRAVFALVFAPLGCLARFYTSLLLNGKIAGFPLGTFTVNILGTLILGMAYDLQRVPLGATVGCQVLQGIQDGFCGCLTTVSTWVSELSSLRKKHAYIYGAVSAGVALAGLVVVMGSMRWTTGWMEPVCL